MSTKRQGITPAMKVSCLLFRWFTPCSICGLRIDPEGKVEWDHVHALVHDGAHHYTNLRPVHAECHKAKSAKDVKANAKIKRIRGETKQGPKRKIPSRPFQKKRAA